MCVDDIKTCMKSLAEDVSIKQPRFGPGNPWSEFPVSSAHECMKAASIVLGRGQVGHKSERGQKKLLSNFKAH